jgi:hypothetical protein
MGNELVRIGLVAAAILAFGGCSEQKERARVGEEATRQRTELAPIAGVDIDGECQDLAFDPTTNSLVYATDRGLYRYSVNTGRTAVVLEGPDFRRVAVSGNGLVAVSDSDGVVLLSDNRVSKRLAAGGSWLLSFSPDGGRLLCAQGSRLEVWDVREATLVAARDLAARVTLDVDWVADGQRLLLALSESKPGQPDVVLLDAGDLGLIEGRQCGIVGVGASVDGAGNVLFYDEETRELRRYNLQRDIAQPLSDSHKERLLAAESFGSGQFVTLRHSVRWHESDDGDPRKTQAEFTTWLEVWDGVNSVVEKSLAGSWWTLAIGKDGLIAVGGKSQIALYRLTWAQMDDAKP